MTLAITDAASALQQWLTTDDSAATLRAAIQGGATNILEAGDMTVDILAEAQAARRAAGAEDTVILALSIQDAGEEGDGDESTQHVILRLFDRDRGYRNLRMARDLLRTTLTYDFALPAVTAGGEKLALLHWRFVGRTGYRPLPEYAADFEAITYSVLVIHEDED